MCTEGINSIYKSDNQILHLRIAENIAQRQMYINTANATNEIAKVILSFAGIATLIGMSEIATQSFEICKVNSPLDIAVGITLLSAVSFIVSRLFNELAKSRKTETQALLDVINNRPIQLLEEIQNVK